MWGLKAIAQYSATEVLGISSSKLQGSQAATSLYNQGKCHNIIVITVTYGSPPASALDEVVEVITVLLDYIIVVVEVQCVCARNQGMLIFTMQIHKVFFCFRALRRRGTPPPPSRALPITWPYGHAMFRFFHHGAPPSHFLDPPLKQTQLTATTPLRMR